MLCRVGRINAFLLLIIFIQCLSLSSAAGEGEQKFNAVLPAWVPLMVLALFFGFGIAAVAYMLSSLFRIPELGVWAKTEVAEVTASAFLVAIILMALGLIDGAFVAATGSTPLQTSIGFAKNNAEQLLNLYDDSVRISTGVGLLSIPLQYQTGGAGGGGFSGDKQSAKKIPMSSTAKKTKGMEYPAFMMRYSLFNINSMPFMSTNTLTGFFGGVQGIALTSAMIGIAFETLLRFIGEIAIPVMLPLGVFLSAFTLTRKMGRTLIAFGVGLYLFVPASVLMAQFMTESVYAPGRTPSQIQEPSGAGIGTLLTAYGLAMQYVVAVLSLNIKAFDANGALHYQELCPEDCTVECFPSCVAVWTWSGAIQCLLCHMRCDAICTWVTAPFVKYPIGDTLSDYLLGATQRTLPLAGLTPIVSGELSASELASLSTATALSAASNFGQVPAYYFLERGISDKLVNVAVDYVPYTMQLAVPFILLPFIAFLVTITAVRSISPAIGGEIQVLGVAELA